MRAILYCLLCSPLLAQSLPGLYYDWLEKGIDETQRRLAQYPQPTLRLLEAEPAAKHFPHAILPPALLFAKKNNPTHLALAQRIGDLLATEDEAGNYTNRLDHPWDTYMWLEAYRLLEKHLDSTRKQRWREALKRNIARMVDECRAWRDFPRYNALHIGTSTNHFAQWAQSLYLGGRILKQPDWEQLGAQILKRLAETEQSQDGFWGEAFPNAPTNGYSLLTLAAVGVYAEHSRDPVAHQALLRATKFHTHFTWPNGVAIETINDRNREWGANLYGNFAFSHTPQGRSLALQIARGQLQHELTMEWIGRVAQNALYFHEGKVEALPANWTYQLQNASAAVGREGPWMWCLSGIAAPRLDHSQWFLDRQALLSIYHDKVGPIIIGANSKRQPELATFRESAAGIVTAQPLEATLISPTKLAVAYKSFFANIELTPKNANEFDLRIRVTGRGPKPDSAFFTLQTPNPKTSKWRIETTSAWQLQWPIHPYSPYRNAPDPEASIATWTLPLELKDVKRPFVRPDEQIIEFRIVVD